MTAKLAYEVIMTLPEKERELLFDMLEPQIKKFDLKEVLSDKVPLKISKNEMMIRLIDNCFSKVTDS